MVKTPSSEGGGLSAHVIFADRELPFSPPGHSLSHQGVTPSPAPGPVTTGVMYLLPKNADQRTVTATVADAILAMVSNSDKEIAESWMLRAWDYSCTLRTQIEAALVAISAEGIWKEGFRENEMKWIKQPLGATNGTGTWEYPGAI